MEATFDLEALPGRIPAVLTIGVFDGVHEGHANLLRTVVTRARGLGCRSVAVSFFPHPQTVLRPDRAVPCVAPLGERLQLMAALGLDLCVVMPFTRELASRTAREFVDLLLSRLDLREIWVGPEFALGRGREGNVARLGEIGREVGFTVHTVPELVLDGVPVHSTQVRQALAEGDIILARRLLGRPPWVSGMVVEGERRGRTLGFPTANVAADPACLLPEDGIYATEVVLDVPALDLEAARGAVITVEPPRQTDAWPAATSIGVRPTFGDDGRRTIEAYLIDFQGDLYGRRVRVDLLERLRGEVRFDGVPALVRQMHDDVARTRTVFERYRDGA